MFARPQVAANERSTQQSEATTEDPTLFNFLTFQQLFLAYYASPTSASDAVRDYIRSLIEQSHMSGNSVLNSQVKDLTALSNPLNATEQDINRLTSLQNSKHLQQILLRTFFDSVEVQAATKRYPKPIIADITNVLESILELSGGSIHNQFDTSDLFQAEEQMAMLANKMNALKWDELLERIEAIDLLAKLARNMAKVKYRPSQTLPGNDLISNAYNTYNQNLADLHSRLLQIASNKINSEIDRNPGHPLLKYLDQVRVIVDTYSTAWTRHYQLLPPTSRKLVNIQAFYNLEPEKLQPILLQRVAAMPAKDKRTFLAVILQESAPFHMTERLMLLPEDYANTTIASEAINVRHLIPLDIAEAIMGSEVLDLPISSLLPDLQDTVVIEKVKGATTQSELGSIPNVSQSSALRQSLIRSVLEVGWQIRPELNQIGLNLDKVAEHIIIRGFSGYRMTQTQPQIYIEPTTLANQLQLLVGVYRHAGLMITTNGLPEFAQEICGIPAQRLAEVVFHLKETSDYAETARILTDIGPLFPLGSDSKRKES